MPFQAICPSCRSTLGLADQMRGQKVRCGKCQAVFLAPPAPNAGPPPAARPVVEERPQARPGPVVPPPLPPAARPVARPVVEERLQTRPGPLVPPPLPPAARPAVEERLQARSGPIIPAPLPPVPQPHGEGKARPVLPGPAIRRRSGPSTPLIVGGAAAGALLIGGVVLVICLSGGGGTKDQSGTSGQQANAGKQVAKGTKANAGQPVAFGQQPNAGQPAAEAGQKPVQPVAANGPDNAGRPENPGPARPPAVAEKPAPARKALRYRWQGGPHVYAVRVEAEKDDSFDVHEGNCVIHVRPADGPRPPAEPEERKGTGTGFVVNADGYLVTCAHVVSDAIKVEVTLGGKSYPGTVLGLDYDHDLAVVKIAARGLPSLPLADSDAAEVGQEVRALGFPLSDFLGNNLKATRGTISGINVKEGRKLFQVDASINPGNSGGPLVSETGAVLGINSAKLAGSTISNIGFATPSNDARKFLAGKGIVFQAAGAGAKLEGPALVKRVRPAVALITVTVGEQADDTVFRLTCRGHLVNRQRGKGGFRVPAPPRISGSASEVEMDGAGRILQAKGGTQLPLLLGDLGQLFIEPLPPDDRSRWETESVCTITEGSSSARPFGPRAFPRSPRFGPRRPIGPRGPAVPNQTRTRQAVEHAVYTRGAVAGDTVTILKRYEMKLEPGPNNAPGLHLVFAGPITFDVKDGLPRAVDFKGTFTVTVGGSRHRLPFSVSYKLLDGAERERVLHPPPPPKVEPKPFEAVDLNRALADLRETDRFRRMGALDRLAKAQPDNARRAEVAKAVEPLLAEQDGFVRRAAIKALAVWGTRDSVPALLKLLGDNDVFTRMETMTALGKLKDERAAGPLAERLVQNPDRHSASQALQALGPKAEKAVLPYLKHADWGVRSEACKILKVIGTPASKPALEEAARDKSAFVAMDAKKALEAIAGRP